MARNFQECILTEEQALVSVSRWKTALSLDEWEIYLSYVRTEDFGIGREPENSSLITKGWLHPNFLDKTACMCIINPTDDERKANFLQPWDMEKTIVHELLHIHFANAVQGYNGLSKNTRVPTEQAIELIACAMVAAYRQEIA